MALFRAAQRMARAFLGNYEQSMAKLGKRDTGSRCGNGRRTACFIGRKLDEAHPKVTLKTRGLTFVLCLLLMPWVAFAHVGSPNIFFEGDAGPYPVRVMIRPPRVVPGLAEISVRVNTNGVSKISVLPARWDTGRKGSPPPDVCALVPGETNLYTAQLWL